MFEEKYNFERFFRFVDDSKVLLTTETKNVAEALNVYRSYLFKEFGRSQTMLIIDGIDELTEDTSSIFYVYYSGDIVFSLFDENGNELLCCC